MPELKCFFLDHDVDINPDPQAYAEFFLNYQSSKWQKGSGDGVFSYISDEGDKSELSVLENKELGISVRYNIRISGERTGAEFYSVGTLNKINVVKNCGDDQFVPEGSFLKPDVAWLAVEDFLKNPRVKSVRITWLNSDDISWPDR